MITRFSRWKEDPMLNISQRLMFSTVALLTVSAVSACDNLAQPSANHNQSAGTMASQALPPNMAGSPVTLNLPRRMQKSPPMYAYEDNHVLQIGSHATGWQGRIVKVYYVPPQNVSDNGKSFVLESSVNLQQLSTALIEQDGSWHTSWAPKHIGVRIRPVYLLAETNTGQVGFVKVGLKNS